MRKCLIATLALAVLALTATALPALSADNGTVTLTVTATAGPCVAFEANPGTQVDFGTRNFSTPAQASFATGNVQPRFYNCGPPSESILIEGDDAQGPSSTWSLDYTNSPNTCPTLNSYFLYYSLDGFGGAPIQKTKNGLLNLKTGIYPSTWLKNERHDLGLSLMMPCLGSNGAGDAFSIHVTLTATA